MRFIDKSVKELQSYLKDRGVTVANLRKQELIDKCVKAKKLAIYFDPDGLKEDRVEITRKKLQLMITCH